MRHWLRIADNLRDAGFSWGCSCESDSTGRVLFTADAYAPDDRRFTVLAGDRLTVFVELHAAIHRQGWVSAVSREVRTIWIADAHRGDGKRYVVRSDEILTALLELESAVAATKPEQMQPALPEVSICPNCGGVLEKTIGNT